MTTLDWVLIALILVIALLPLALRVFKVARHVPRGKRGVVAGFALRELRKPSSTQVPPAGAPPHVLALYSPGEPRRVVPWESWHEGPLLVTDTREVTDGRSASYGSGLDVDGAVLMLERNDDGGYALSIVGPDGSVTKVAEERDGAVLDASIDRGRCAWWHVPHGESRAEIRVWSAERGARTVGSRAFEIDALSNGPAGWLILAGDTVVGTLLSGVYGVAVAAREEHGIATVGTTGWITVTRDVAAELRGEARVSVALIGDETDRAHQLSSLDLSHFPPRVRPIRRGPILPGATVACGEPVAQWTRPRLLQLPGGLNVTAAPGQPLALDPVSDGEYAAVGQYVDVGRGGTRQNAVVLHLPTGARQSLARDILGRMQIRNGHILWNEVVSPTDSSRTTASPLTVTHVGRLTRPDAGVPSAG